MKIIRPAPDPRINAIAECLEQNRLNEPEKAAAFLLSVVRDYQKGEALFDEMLAGSHDLDTLDPAKPDGSCAHDYLCAYCNDALEGSVVETMLDALGHYGEDVSWMEDSDANGEQAREAIDAYAKRPNQCKP